jgi:hypothetical protein
MHVAAMSHSHMRAGPSPNERAREPCGYEPVRADDVGPARRSERTRDKGRRKDAGLAERSRSANERSKVGVRVKSLPAEPGVRESLDANGLETSNAPPVIRLRR